VRERERKGGREKLFSACGILITSGRERDCFWVFFFTFNFFGHQTRPKTRERKALSFSVV